APLELLAAVAQEARPMGGARDDLAQLRHHLATVAHAKRERRGAREELAELVAQGRAFQDRRGPAAAGAQHVAVAEAAAGDEAVEAIERGAPGDEVAHVHVDRGKAGAVEADRHLDLAVDALLAQDRDPGPGAG